MKKLFALLLVFLMLLSFAGCSLNSLEKPETNLEFWIAENVDDVDFSKYQEKYGMMGGRQYYGSGYIPSTDKNDHQVDPAYCVLYTVTSYPDYASKKKHITNIEITDPSIEIYGLTLNSSFENIETTMKNEGFDIEKTSGGVIATKGKFSISFSANSIYIGVDVTNIFGMAF